MAPELLSGQGSIAVLGGERGRGRVLRPAWVSQRL